MECAQRYNANFPLSAKDFENLEDDHVSALSQIGPPKNLSVSVKPDGFFINWESPDYGQDMLDLYVVRWFQEPEHKLHGKGETTNNYFMSMSYLVFHGGKTLKSFSL